MQFKVTHFTSEKQVNNGTVLSFDSFQEFAKAFTKPEIGDKYGTGFVRGELSPPVRNDKNGNTASIIIIDGDEGKNGRPAPKPIDVHEALMDLNINHFIYTSWSHKVDSDKTNKYRVVIESDEYTKDNLDINNKAILNTLTTMGIHIKYVKEMKAWSQIWFEPRCNDINKFEFYEYHDGAKWRCKKNEEISNTEQEESVCETISLDEMYENIRTGKEYHTSLRTISYQMVKDGMSKAHVKANLKSMMNGSLLAGSQRWQERYDGIDRLVDGVKEDSAGLTDGIIGVSERKINTADIPIPPGAMGELCNFIYNNMLYQYDKIAVVCAIGSIAAIAGRKFNVIEPKPCGLNCYLTVVAPTGYGKGAIGDYFTYLFRSGLGGKIKAARSFLGPYKITGDKALHNCLLNARSRVIVMPEAGLVMRTKSGSPESMMAYLLEVYSQSHRFGAMGESAYSSQEDSLSEIRAPALSMVCESTIDNIKLSYKESGAVESGYLPRMTMIRIDKRVIDINKNVLMDCPDWICRKYAHLMEMCSQYQTEDDPKPHEMKFSAGVRAGVMDFIRDCNVKSDESEDRIKSAMFTRMALKAIKFSAICTVWNKSESDSNNLVIEMPEWEWGKKLATWEMNTIGYSLGFMGNDEWSECMHEILIKITAFLNDKINNKELRLMTAERKKGVIPLYSLVRACRTLPSVRQLQSTQKGYKNVIESAVDRLVDAGVCKIKSTNPITLHNQRVIIINQSFDDYCKSYIGIN